MRATRRLLMSSAGAALFLAACQKNPASGVDAGADVALGDPNAKVTLIEYASVTCSHCAEFHEHVWPKLKANYIDTKKIRFVFREFLAGGAPEIALAGFQVARCVGDTPEKYFSVIDTLFEQQNLIFEAAGRGAAREPLLNIAKSAGLSEERFAQCVSDPQAQKRIKAVMEKGEKAFKIEGTPTLILNGEKLTDASAYTYEGLAKLIDAKLAGA